VGATLDSGPNRGSMFGKDPDVPAHALQER
jgi:hypothetical protein